MLLMTLLVAMVVTDQLDSNMRVRIVVEYGELLPVDLRDEYYAPPRVEAFEYFFDDSHHKEAEMYSRTRVIRDLLKRDIVCEFIRTLDLELC